MNKKATTIVIATLLVIAGIVTVISNVMEKKENKELSTRKYSVGCVNVENENR